MSDDPIASLLSVSSHLRARIAADPRLNRSIQLPRDAEREPTEATRLSSLALASIAAIDMSQSRNTTTDSSSRPSHKASNATSSMNHEVNSVLQKRLQGPRIRLEQCKSAIEHRLTAMKQCEQSLKSEKTQLESMIVQTFASHLNSALSDMQQHTQHVTALQQRVQSQLGVCDRVLKTDSKSDHETDSEVVNHMNTLTDIDRESLRLSDACAMLNQMPPEIWSHFPVKHLASTSSNNTPAVDVADWLPIRDVLAENQKLKDELQATKVQLNQMSQQQNAATKEFQSQHVSAERDEEILMLKEQLRVAESERRQLQQQLRHPHDSFAHNFPFTAALKQNDTLSLSSYQEPIKTSAHVSDKAVVEVQVALEALQTERHAAQQREQIWKQNLEQLQHALTQAQQQQQQIEHQLMVSEQSKQHQQHAFQTKIDALQASKVHLVSLETWSQQFAQRLRKSLQKLSTNEHSDNSKSVVEKADSTFSMSQTSFAKQLRDTFRVSDMSFSAATESAPVTSFALFNTLSNVSTSATAISNKVGDLPEWANELDRLMHQLQDVTSERLIPATPKSQSDEYKAAIAQLKAHHEQELTRLRALAADARNSVESQLQQKLQHARSEGAESATAELRKQSAEFVKTVKELQESLVALQHTCEENNVTISRLESAKSSVERELDNERNAHQRTRSELEMSSKSALSAVDFDTVRPLKAQVQRLELQLQQASQDLQRAKAAHDSQQQQSEQQYRRSEQAKSTLEEKARLREQEWKLELQAAIQNAKSESASQARALADQNAAELRALRVACDQELREARLEFDEKLRRRDAEWLQEKRELETAHSSAQAALKLQSDEALSAAAAESSRVLSMLNEAEQALAAKTKELLVLQFIVQEREKVWRATQSAESISFGDVVSDVKSSQPLAMNAPATTNRVIESPVKQAKPIPATIQPTELEPVAAPASQPSTPTKASTELKLDIHKIERESTPVKRGVRFAMWDSEFTYTPEAVAHAASDRRRQAKLIEPNALSAESERALELINPRMFLPATKFKAAADGPQMKASNSSDSLSLAAFARDRYEPARVDSEERPRVPVPRPSVSTGTASRQSRGNKSDSATSKLHAYLNGKR